MPEGRKTHRSGEALSGIVNQAGQKFFSFKKTLTGSPTAILFAQEGLPDMEDVAYRVMPFGEHAALGPVTCVDESTIATTGFSVINGAAAEVVHILIHGNVAE